MSRILLAVSGGIAAYKAAALCSTLVQRGDEVEVAMTRAARHFIGEATFAALTHRPVHRSLWDRSEEIEHIALARNCELIAVVPATANVLAKLAHGIADDLITNLALAARVPLLVAPAMNDAMYEHPATVENLRTLVARGVTVVPPGIGFLAEREFGVGRLAEPETIVAAIDRLLARGRELAGETVLITAGPTREALDPVRFLSNAASGTMGIELAREALGRGAEVELVLGPTPLAPPQGARVARIETADEMLAAARAKLERADIVIATAAVCDWRPAQRAAQKVKKGDGPGTLALERTPDVLAVLAAEVRGAFVVGFAAETEHHERNAREKLRRKALDAIAVNDVARGGFGSGENALVLLWGEDGREDLGRAGKPELARRLWDALLRLRSSERARAPSVLPRS
ncbi:MAG: bifunctional phosphopantothenoylcysteine decarboxylase/phosphopantothenate--cysteine ligase CoaBC [Vulcanimicrobiaceae bacterium]